MPEKFELEAHISGFGGCGAPNVYYIVLQGCKPINEIARPGQFVMLWPKPESYELLLGRPFSIYGAPPPPWEKHYADALHLIFKKVGKGTELLVKGRAGGKVRVLGPLGNGFNLEIDFKEALLVSGGIGIAALMWLARKLAQQEKKIHFLLGVRTEKEFVCLDECIELGTVHFATEDGSARSNILFGDDRMAIMGSTADLLQNFVVSYPWQIEKPYIFASGPMAMLKEVVEIAKIHNVPAQVAVEARMACGVGACLGCAIKVKDENDPDWTYKRVCTDGPIFDAQEVIWDDAT